MHNKPKVLETEITSCGTFDPDFGTQKGNYPHDLSWYTSYHPVERSITYVSDSLSSLSSRGSEDGVRANSTGHKHIRYLQVSAGIFQYCNIVLTFRWEVFLETLESSEWNECAGLSSVGWCKVSMAFDCDVPCVEGTRTVSNAPKLEIHENNH